MEIVRQTHQIDPFTSVQLDRYFGGLTLCVFDIETMGLNPASSEMILAGVMQVQPDGSCQTIQYFAERREDEPAVLAALAETLSACDYVLTYNGKHFDLPFVARRASHYGMPTGFLDGLYNLDLYLVLKGHSQLKAVLGNLRQKTVEDYMGLHPQRADQISGAESIALYERFERETNSQKKDRLKAKILLHNHDDLLQLYQLLPVIKQTDFHRAMSYLGFPVKASESPADAQNGWPQLNICKIRIDYAGLSITGTYGGPGFSYMAYEAHEQPCSCSFAPDGTFSLLLPTERRLGSHYINLRRYLNDETAFTRFPGYVNGFLVLTEGTKISYMEMNLLAIAFLRQLMAETPCPLGKQC